MNMDIFILIEIRINSEHVRVTADAVDRDFRALLHNVAKRTCQLQLARAVHQSDFYRQQLTADRRPCKSVDNTDFVLFVQLLRQILLVTEQTLNLRFIYFEALLALLELFYRALAHEVGNRAFQRSDTRFAGIEINQRVNSLLCEF